MGLNKLLVFCITQFLAVVAGQVNFLVRPGVYTTDDNLQMTCSVDPQRNIFTNVTQIAFFRNGNIINTGLRRITVTRSVTSPAQSAQLGIRIGDLHCSNDEGAYGCRITGRLANNSVVTISTNPVNVRSKVEGEELRLSYIRADGLPTNDSDTYPLGTKLRFACTGMVGKPQQSIRWCVDPEGFFNVAEERQPSAPQQCGGFNPNTCQTQCVSTFEYTVEEPEVDISCSVNFLPLICKGQESDEITINGATGLNAYHMGIMLLTMLQSLIS